MSKKENQVKLATKLLTEATVYHFGGFENSYDDGKMTKEEILPMFTMENFIKFAGEELNRSMEKNAMLEAPTSGTMMEAKHLKFLGTETLEQIKNMAGVTAFSKFFKFSNQLKGGN